MTDLQRAYFYFKTAMVFKKEYGNVGRYNLCMKRFWHYLQKVDNEN